MLPHWLEQLISLGTRLLQPAVDSTWLLATFNMKCLGSVYPRCVQAPPASLVGGCIWGWRGETQLYQSPAEQVLSVYQNCPILVHCALRVVVREAMFVGPGRVRADSIPRGTQVVRLKGTHYKAHPAGRHVLDFPSILFLDRDGEGWHPADANVDRGMFIWIQPLCQPQ